MGYVSDSFGRRTIIITLSVVHILSSFITSFSSNFPMFVIVRFFVGGSIHAVWSAFFVLMAEIVPEDSRHSIYIRTVSFWSSTICFVSDGLAWLYAGSANKHNRAIWHTNHDRLSKMQTDFLGISALLNWFTSCLGRATCTVRVSALNFCPGQPGRTLFE